MQEKDIMLLLGKFDSKIATLEKTVDRLESCVEQLSLTLAERKSGWQSFLMLGSISALIGSSLHRPIQALIDLFK